MGLRVHLLSDSGVGPMTSRPEWDDLMSTARILANHRDQRVRVVAMVNGRAGKWVYVIECPLHCGCRKDVGGGA